MKKLIDEHRRNLFHEGEIALQRSVGMAERIKSIGAKVVRDFMPDQHREFYARLPFIVAATVDESGDVWPTMFTGQPGFVGSPSPTSLTINAKLDAADPAASQLHADEAIGLLGIELHTRRRNRINGKIIGSTDGPLVIEVGQAFGNCPQYIQLRDYAFADEQDRFAQEPAEETTGLTDKAREIISTADTFFVASYVERLGVREVDVSHRGGKPGFVRIDEDGLLTVPDFSGNFYFNTLGNFVVNPRAGLLFVDFETGDILQLAGMATVITDSPEIAAFEGAERLWTFRPDRMVLRRGASALRWAMRENAFSAKSLRTGSWEQTTRQLVERNLERVGAGLEIEG